MALLSPDELLAEAVALVGTTVQRTAGREADAGLRKVELEDALLRAVRSVGGTDIKADLAVERQIGGWSLPTSPAGIYAKDAERGTTHFVAEFRVWDVQDQLVDLARVGGFLQIGVPAGFLISVLKQDRGYDRGPGGDLFPAVKGESHEVRWEELIGTSTWATRARRPGPRPTSLPSVLSTTAISDPVAIEAYPGHSLRAVRVQIVDAAPLKLTDGLLAGAR